MTKLAHIRRFADVAVLRGPYNSKLVRGEVSGSSPLVGSLPLHTLAENPKVTAKSKPDPFDANVVLPCQKNISSIFLAT
jgi:hypothetical protein